MVRKVLTVDQGYANCGVCVLGENEKEHVILYELFTIKTPSSIPFSQRLHAVYMELKKALYSHIVDVVYMGCEKLFFNPAIKADERNKSASILPTNMVTGLIFLLAAQYNIPIKEYTPGSIKKVITGHGASSKNVLENNLHYFAATQGFHIKTSHEADALGMAITLLFEQKEGII